MFGASCKANGGPSSSENRAHRPGEDGEPSPGGVRSLLQGQWGAIIFGEPGAPAWGGRGAQPRGCLEPPARTMAGHHLRRTGRTGLGRTGSPAQGVFGASCKSNGGTSSSENRAHRPGGDGESSPRGFRSLLPGQWGAIICREPGAPAWGGRGAQPRGCSEPPASSMGGHHLRRTGRTGLGGTGGSGQEVFGAPCKANGGPSSSENRAHRPGEDGEPRGVRSLLQGEWGAIIFGEPGAPAWGDRGPSPGGVRSLLQGQWGGGTCLGRTGSPAEGVFGASCKANGGTSSSENRAHRPGGDGGPSPGSVRSLLQGEWGAIIFGEPGAPAWGDRGPSPGGVRSLLQGQWGAIIFGEPGAPALGGRGPSPGGVRSLLPGQWGAIIFREPGAPAWGGRGAQPRGCSEAPARPKGGQYLRRTGRTGLGGTGSPAKGVFGASCKANGGPSSSENRAQGGVRSLLQGQWGAIIFLGGTGSPAAGGVRSLLQGQWGAIIFREPGAPAWGGRGTQPRGCSEPPARPMGGHHLRAGRTGVWGTGSPA